MGMADTRTEAQKNEYFETEKDRIINMVEELRAVNTLEYHNKNWLSGDNQTRCQNISELLLVIKNTLSRLQR